MALEPIMGTLAVRWEYTQAGTGTLIQTVTQALDQIGDPEAVMHQHYPFHNLDAQ